MYPDKKLPIAKKVCLVGDGAVGKTSLVRKFVLDKYDDSYIQTLGAKVMRKDVIVGREIEERTVQLLIWDIMGQKELKIINSTAFEGVQGGFIVCDLTMKGTLDNIPYWIRELTNISGSVPLIVLANKNDLVDQMEYDVYEVTEAATNLGCEYYLTSAKTGENVETAFNKLAELCLKGVRT